MVLKYKIFKSSQQLLDVFHQIMKVQCNITGIIKTNRNIIAHTNIFIYLLILTYEYTKF